MGHNEFVVVLIRFESVRCGFEWGLDFRWRFKRLPNAVESKISAEAKLLFVAHFGTTGNQNRVNKF